MGVVIYYDPETAHPLAIMDGTTLTRYRTGAVAGVASRYLGPPDATSLGLLGAGKQAHFQLAAVASVSDLDRIVVADIEEDAQRRFIDQEQDRDIEVTTGDPRDVAGCDVVSTTTPSRSSIIERDWVEKGTHINAIGADAEGKQELDPATLDDAEVVIDDWEQCSHGGEINVPVTNGRLDREDVHADLSAVVTGDAPAASEEITVFDSTGLAIQDVATARLVYETAKQRSLGTELELVGT
jgi:alanine dehydrogenase